MDNNKIEQYKKRLYVSDLIIEVLTDKKSVKEALSLFPKDNTDINIKCAFDALLHKEADEDLRRKIKGYALVQDNYLYDLAQILKKNGQLPKNIIAQYLKFHQDNLISTDEKWFTSIVKSIKRMIHF